MEEKANESQRSNSVRIEFNDDLLNGSIKNHSTHSIVNSSLANLTSNTYNNENLTITAMVASIQSAGQKAAAINKQLETLSNSDQVSNSDKENDEINLIEEKKFEPNGQFGKELNNQVLYGQEDRPIEIIETKSDEKPVDNKSKPKPKKQPLNKANKKKDSPLPENTDNSNNSKKLKLSKSKANLNMKPIDLTTKSGFTESNGHQNIQPNPQNNFQQQQQQLAHFSLPFANKINAPNPPTTAPSIPIIPTNFQLNPMTLMNQLFCANSQWNAGNQINQNSFNAFNNLANSANNTNTVNNSNLINDFKQAQVNLKLQTLIIK